MNHPPRGRRDFLKLSAVAALAGPLLGGEAKAAETPSRSVAGEDDRHYWCGMARRLATPVIEALANRRLKKIMPVETSSTAGDRPLFSHLEALGRLLCGIAPWLELDADESAEGRERVRFGVLARAAIDAATDPQSPDFLNFREGRQPLVDAAFLAQAMLRAPRELWERLPDSTRRNVQAALESTRGIVPGESNWKLFATMVEVFLHRAGLPRDEARLREGIDRHQAWYLGDGVYGDGPEFHWDYYNSFVIQPMLVEALDVVGGESPAWTALRTQAHARLQRWADLQERLIAPDGSYPAIGRSITYRCGAFHGLALAALRGALPARLAPARVRAALTSVIRRTLDAPDTWDGDGWLRVGLAGHQPALGERYISTGSLYLCSAALLPLGLPPGDPFWTAPAPAGSWEQLWAGADYPPDHALAGRH